MSMDKLKEQPRCLWAEESDREDENIVRMSSENPFMSAREIKQDSHLECDRRTVSNRLRDAGLKSYAPARKTLLTEDHKDCRLERARQKSNWSSRG